MGSKEKEGTRTPIKFNVLMPDALKSKHNFSRLYGMDDIVKLIRDWYIIPAKHPEMFSESLMNTMLPNMLLYGPAGTGKTELILSMAAEMNCVLIKVSATELHSMWQGETKNRFGDLLKQCEELDNALPGTPVMVFMDEADVLLAKDALSTGSQDTDIVEVFKEAVSVGIPDQKKSPRNVIWVAATNRPNSIVDIGVLGRFALKRYIGFPFSNTIAIRTYMLVEQLKKISLDTCTGQMFDWESFEANYSNHAVIRDVERALWFLTPRELSIVVKDIIGNLEYNPIHMSDYRYSIVPRVILEKNNERMRAMESRAETEAQRQYYQTVVPDGQKAAEAAEIGQAENAKMIALTREIREHMRVADEPMCAFPIRRADADPWRSEIAISKGSGIIEANQMDRTTLSRAYWSTIKWPDVVYGIRKTRVTTSLTWEALKGFYTYSRFTVQDGAGLQEILRTIAMGDPGAKYLTADFARDCESKLPRWPIYTDAPAEMQNTYRTFLQGNAVFDGVARVDAGSGPSVRVFPKATRAAIPATTDYAALLARSAQAGIPPSYTKIPLSTAGGVEGLMLRRGFHDWVVAISDRVARELHRMSPAFPPPNQHKITDAIVSVLKKIVSEKSTQPYTVADLLNVEKDLIAFLLDTYEKLILYSQNGQRWPPGVPVIATLPWDDVPQVRKKKYTEAERMAAEAEAKEQEAREIEERRAEDVIQIGLGQAGKRKRRRGDEPL